MEGTVLNLSLETEDTGFDDYRYANHKTIVFLDIVSQPISIEQDWKLGKGGILWDSSYILSKYMHSHFDFRGKRVIELGAGCALASIIVGSMGADVVSTDLQPTLQLTSRNILRNQAVMNQSHVVELDWTKPEHRLNLPYDKFDVILMSDLFYLPVTITQSLAESLLATVLALCKEDTQILATFKFRADFTLNPFLEAFSKNFDFTYVTLM